VPRHRRIGSLREHAARGGKPAGRRPWSGVAVSVSAASSERTKGSSLPRLLDVDGSMRTFSHGFGHVGPEKDRRTPGSTGAKSKI
jgi:hypothetical protein